MNELKNRGQLLPRFQAHDSPFTQGGVVIVLALPRDGKGPRLDLDWDDSPVQNCLARVLPGLCLSQPKRFHLFRLMFKLPLDTWIVYLWLVSGP